MIALLATFGATVGVAAVSWHFLEEPLLKVRRHFEADPREGCRPADLGGGTSLRIRT